MSKDPAVLLYTSDFLSGCQDLTMVERGQFITLLCLQHQKGYLTAKIIKLTCGDNVSEDVLERFNIDENGNYFNKRMDSEIKKRKSNSEKQSKRAKDYWAKVKQKKEETTSVDSSTAYATALPLENENENENEIINRNRNKNKSNIPTKEEFLEYASVIYKQLEKDFEPFKFPLLAKYTTWIDNGWKNGHNKPIKNWKNTLNNTIPHIKGIYNGRKNNTNTDKYASLKAEISKNLQPR